MEPTPSTKSVSPSYFATHSEDVWSTAPRHTLERIVGMTGEVFGDTFQAWVDCNLDSEDWAASRPTLAVTSATLRIMSTLISALSPGSFNPTLDSTPFDVDRLTIEPLIAAEHRPLFNSYCRLVEAMSEGTDTEEDTKNFQMELLKNKQFEAAVLHKADALVSSTNEE